ncbi:MAG: hypothetical protein K2O29_06910, partial [Ruminococcus sp.]|nr:hypothetical protein [Ruminococcus sp.]
MKKLLSTFMALSMLTSLPVCSVYAESNAELDKFASSLGADTDYLSLAGQYYYTNEDTGDIYCYTKDLPEIQGAHYTVDASFGISVMEILAHNGLISAGDIRDGVESLSQIIQVSDVRNLIEDYQNLFNKFEFRVYRNYLFQSTSAAEKIDILCNTAEECMNEGKYFLIMYGSYGEQTHKLVETTDECQGHCAVGMGITDGSWTFNGKTYDKCILTLDSFSAYKNSSSFSEDTCIYVNSETKESYIPQLSDYAKNDMHIAVVDDDKLLNFEGPINPTDSFDTDISELMLVRYIGYGTHGNIRELSYTDKNGKEVVMNEEEGYVKNFLGIRGKSIIADSFRHRILSENQRDALDVTNANGFVGFSFAGADSELYFDKNECYKFVRLEHAEDDTTHDENAPLQYTMSYHQDYKGRNFTFGFRGETMDEAEFKVLDNGVVFSGGSAKFTVYPKDWNYEDNLASVALSSSNEVFVQYDKTDGFKIMADLDNDGNFEHQVENGDVNCDGFIDSVDAAAVLQAYAKLSVQDSRNPETVYADNLLSDFNGDG